MLFRSQGMMETLKIDEDMPIDAKILSNSIEQAQKTVESRNFQTRKNVLEYDDVMNKQREIIYGERRKVLDGEDLQEQIRSMVREFVSGTIIGGLGGAPVESQEQLDDAVKPFETLFLPRGRFRAEDYAGRAGTDKLVKDATEQAERVYAARETAFGPDPRGVPLMRELERVIMLRVVDEYWMDHIDAMTELKRGIGLRGYGNVKPIDAYKQEGLRHVRGHGARHPRGDGAPLVHRRHQIGRAHV